jgi:heterodisulfide reductase subunit A
VADFAWNLPDVVRVERLDYACFPEAQCYIKNVIAESNLNRVVMAGCSHRTHESLYQRAVRETGLNPYYMEMVNLREQCAWVHMNEPDKATRKAKELVRMAAARGDDATVHKKRSPPPSVRWCWAAAWPA